MVNVVYTIHGENKRNLFFLPNSQKAFAFVEYGTRRCPSSSDRPVVGKETKKAESNSEKDRLISYF